MLILVDFFIGVGFFLVESNRPTQFRLLFLVFIFFSNSHCMFILQVEGILARAADELSALQEERKVL